MLCESYGPGIEPAICKSQVQRLTYKGGRPSLASDTHLIYSRTRKYWKPERICVRETSANMEKNIEQKDGRRKKTEISSNSSCMPPLKRF